jgi:hypothetical protein
MPTKDILLEIGRQYHALLIKDLLEARNAYHGFLIEVPQDPLFLLF